MPDLTQVTCCLATKSVKLTEWLQHTWTVLLELAKIFKLALYAVKMNESRRRHACVILVTGKHCGQMAVDRIKQKPPMCSGLKRM